MGRPNTTAGRRRAELEALASSLMTPETMADPYPVYARLRALAPVLQASSGSVYLTAYDDCVAVMRDPALGAQSAEWMDTVRPGWRNHPGLRITAESFLFRNPPEHTRLRRFVSSAFTQRRAEELRDYITHRTDLVLDAVADAGREGASVDLHEVLAASLPISVIGKVLGVPEADQPQLREPLEGLRLAVDGGTSAANVEVIDRAAVALRGYFADLVAARRRAPLDDLASALVAVTDGQVPGGGPGGGSGGGLTEEEMLQTLTLIFSAAIESMVDLLLNGTAALLAHPAEADLLRADPGLAGGAVEEALRYDPPVQAMGRVPATDMTIGGVQVSAGSLVIAMLGAANRDPARFADPETFDISRTGTTVLSFGGGIHFCLGAALARLEAGIFFPALVTRFPALRLAATPIRRGVVLRGFSEFRVTVR
jgi:cytochrome P450